VLPIAIEQDQPAPDVPGSKHRCPDLEEDAALASHHRSSFSGDELEVRAAAEGFDRTLG
jgi:hypothetical protein